MQDDAELLRLYAETRSEAALGELVGRHLDLVYAAALRQTFGNAHLSQDIAQTVFIDLARKAPSLRRETVLVGWLHTATRFEAAKAMRAAQRRSHYEEEAGMTANLARDEEAPIDPAQLQPVIDAAIGELKPREREAILLRYFEGCAFAQVGDRLHITESAARSCVDRALAKMRVSLKARGLASTTAALSAALAGQQAVSAPAGFAATVTSSALAAGSTAFSGVTTATLLFMGMTKLQTAIVGGLIVAAGTGIALQSYRASELNREPTGLRQQAGKTAELQHRNRALQDEIDAGKARASELARQRADRDEQARRSEPRTVPQAAPAPVVEMIKIEDFRNEGTATPWATFQTMVWASLKGEDDALEKLFVLEPGAVEAANAFLNALPAESRGKFSSPERLASLLFSEEMLRKGAGAQIESTQLQDATHAIAKIRTWTVSGNSGTSDLPFVRTGGDWQLAVPRQVMESMIRKLRRYAAQTPSAK